MSYFIYKYSIVIYNFQRISSTFNVIICLQIYKKKKT